MLQQADREKFSRATAIWNSADDENAPEWASLCEPADVVETFETLEYHETSRGRKADEVKTSSAGTLYVWRSVQMARGRRRGEMFLMDFGYARGAFFTGDAA